VKAIKLVANSPVPPGNPLEAFLLAWGKDFEQKTGGRYTVEVIGGGALASTTESYDALVGGVADIAVFQPPMTQKPFPIANIPVLFWGPVPGETMSKAWYEDIYKKGYLDKDLAEIKVLSVFTGPTGDIETINPINTLADLNGVKLANAQGPDCVEFAKRLGAVSVIAGPPDIYLMLQKGIADGMFGAIPMVKEFHCDDFVKYMLPIQVTHMSHVVGMNRDVYNKMPDDVKKIVDAMAADESYGLDCARAFDVWYTEGLQYFLDKGGKRIEWSPADIAKMNEVAGAIWQENVANLEGQGVPAKKVCDEFYNAMKALGAKPAEIAVGYMPGT
jgi:TRAP-type C4-dicarboxylate transport system substrate-binding protein